MPNGCRTWSPGHRFDPNSGWCEHGCGWRDDGALSIHGTFRINGPEYTPQQLEDLRQKARTT